MPVGLKSLKTASGPTPYRSLSKEWFRQEGGCSSERFSGIAKFFVSPNWHAAYCLFRQEYHDWPISVSGNFTSPLFASDRKSYPVRMMNAHLALSRDVDHLTLYLLSLGRSLVPARSLHVDHATLIADGASVVAAISNVQRSH